MTPVDAAYAIGHRGGFRRTPDGLLVWLQALIKGMNLEAQKISQGPSCLAPLKGS